MKTWLSSLLILSFLAGITACKKEKTDTSDDSYLENVVIKIPDQARMLRLKQDLETVRKAIFEFSITKNRNPNDLDELAREGVLNRIPKEPFGGEWEYDSSSGEFKSTTHPDL